MSQAPLKLNFAGGETDVPSFYVRYGPGVVFTTAIKKYVRVFLSEADEGYKINYPGFTGSFEDVEDVSHPPTREALRRLKVGPGISLTSTGDVPWGTGLGSSSSFLVALLLALHAWLGEDPSPEFLAWETVSITKAIGEPGGKQDPYVAAYGGTGLIFFESDESVGFKALPLSPKKARELGNSLLLCDTGLYRRSSQVQEAQERAVEAHLREFREMRDLALKAYEAASRLDLGELAETADAYWKVRKEIEPSVTNEEIEEIYQKGIKAGALGGRLEGAGAGGFMLFFVRPEDREKVRKALGGHRVMEVQLETRGARLLCNLERTASFSSGEARRSSGEASGKRRVSGFALR